MYDYKKDMGERIRKRRKRLSMTQEFVAEKLGVSVKHFSEVERGLTGLSVENLVKLSDCLGLSLDYMIKGDAGRENPSGVFYIPESVIGVASNEEGFRACCFNCPDLTKITVAKGNRKLTSVGGVLYNKNRTILYRYPAAKAQKSFTVPKSVKTVYTGAFSGCKNLTAVTFPAGSKAVIQSGSFDNCKKLTDVTFSKDVRIAIDAGFGHYMKANAQGVSKDIYIRNMKFKGYKSNKSLADFLECHCYKDNFTPLDKKSKIV